MLRSSLLAAALGATFVADLAAQVCANVAALGRDALAAHELLPVYDLLRERLGSVAKLWNIQAASPRALEILADPLTGPARLEAWSDAAFAAAETGELVDLLGLAATLHGREPTTAGLGGDRLAVLELGLRDLDTRLDVAVELLTDAAREVEHALRAVPVEDRAALREELLAIASALRGTVYVTEVPAHTAAWTERIAKLDVAALERAAAHLTPLAAPGFWGDTVRTARRLPAVDRELDGVTGPVLAVRDTPLGPIVVGGPGPNRFALDAALIVDVGGDDVYVGAVAAARGPERPVAVVVDLWGDDRYLASDGDATDGDADAPPPTQAAAVLGVALLADLRGDDEYIAGSISQGAGLGGVAMLVDARGRDRYRADAWTQGAGLFGHGMLVDLDGDDDVGAHLYSQGTGGPLGMGLLLDLAGDDVRSATGKYPSSYGTVGEFQAFSQGCGIGLRAFHGPGAQLAGGFGLCCDGAGDDTSTVGEFGFGVGYYVGVGMVRDRRGDDRVDASRYGIATGAHQAVGLVVDDAGDDTWTDPHTASLAGNWDHTVSILVDGDGDDVWQGGGITLGSATIVSFAALFDLGGRDRYDAGGSGLSLGHAGHASDLAFGFRSVALFVDEGGADGYANAPGSPPPADGVEAARRRTDTHGERTAESGVGVFRDRGRR